MKVNMTWKLWREKQHEELNLKIGFSRNRSRFAGKKKIKLKSGVARDRIEGEYETRRFT